MNEKNGLGNIFDNIPSDLSEEVFQNIISTKIIRIERIISHGQKSPPDFWYDQEQSEWVILLKGYAEIRFDNNPELIKLNPGNYLNIPAHQKHRVEKTDLNEATIWLAVFY